MKRRTENTSRKSTPERVAGNHRKSPVRRGRGGKQRSASPGQRPVRRSLGATPPPVQLNAEAAEKWKKYNNILEAISHDGLGDEDTPLARPPIFDSRGVEMIAALAPACGKYLFLAKAKSFAWWKTTTIPVCLS